MSSAKINHDALEKDRTATVDVANLVEDLVADAREEMESAADGGNPVDATWDVLEKREPQADLSHCERAYVIAYLFTNYGVDPHWVVEEDRRVSHGTDWDTVTWAMCEFALYDVVSSRLDGSLTPRATLGEWDDSRSDAIRENWTEELQGHIIQNDDAENFVSVLAEAADWQLDADASTEREAIDNAIEQYRDEIFNANPIEQASMFDAFEDIYDMTGENAIETEQLDASTTGGWAEVIETGLVYHALREAVRTHRERYDDIFQTA